ncbi:MULTISPECIES: hypothetical protein [Vibrio]|nr:MULTISPECIES: hypothetical protein [Vibrio]MBO0246495.1 hypothetical protein [Vibrio sp. Vb0592]MCR9637148.1 hypothetical protein [Vibrio alginolyticus]MDW1734795.1 hypothetical protein [Vibrio sp. Vb2235]MDW1786121.1 hypothetical protein [Vibrio sp. Vb2227]MDW1815754.1 hypothetical protein [Vibrio sp. Vb2232]
MAYSPFYITPEELAVYQEAQEQRISSGSNVLRWSVVNVEMPSRYIHLYFTLVTLFVCIAIFFALANFDQNDDTIFLACVLSFCVALFYFLMRWGLLKQYHYVFSEKGLVAKPSSTIPKWMNNASQVTGWVGATTCILMVILVGPMALAGAGAFILVSFKMLKRQPEERTNIRIAERENWLFAYYNKKRKVITLYHRYDDCDYRDVAKTTVSRCHYRGRSFIFFSSTNDLERVLEKLSKEYQLKCTEFEDIKALFNAYSPDELLSEPARSLEFPVDDTFELRAQNAPIPEWEYLYNGKWQTESEIEQSKSKLITTALE